MRSYIYQKKGWPAFSWNSERILPLLAGLRHKQGILSGSMSAVGFKLRDEAMLGTLTLDILKSNEIEGELLNPDQVRSSLARHLGMDMPGLVPSDRNVDGIVEVMLDATANYKAVLSEQRLFGWHTAMFPKEQSGPYKIKVGGWRNGPMQVVSGAMGREKVHFEAPVAEQLFAEMQQFIDWFNTADTMDPVLKAAIAHFWFVTVHPFDDGNGRIARAIADLQLARADGHAERFYSMSAQILNERRSYYEVLEQTQKSDLDITEWLLWFLHCLDRALDSTNETLTTVLKKGNFWERSANTDFNPRQKLMLNKLLDGFDGKLTTAKWAKIAKCSHDTALRDINNLLEKDVLMKEDAGGRSTSYIIKHM